MKGVKLAEFPRNVRLSLFNSSYIEPRLYSNLDEFPFQNDRSTRYRHFYILG